MALTRAQIDARRGAQGGKTRAQRQVEYQRRLRRRAIEAYGGKCVCCENQEWTMLTLDHKDGGGNQERKQYRNNTQFMQYLSREGWPSRIQLLCANCNQSKLILGSCAHVNEVTSNE